MVGSAFVDPELIAVFRELVDVVSGSSGAAALQTSLASVPANETVAQQRLREAATCIQKRWRGILARYKAYQLRGAWAKLRILLPRLVRCWRFRTWRRVRQRLRNSANSPFVRFNTLGRPGELAAATAWLRRSNSHLAHDAQLLRSRCQALQAILEKDMEVAAVRIQAHQRRRIASRRALVLLRSSKETVAAVQAGWHRVAAQRLLLQLRDDNRVASAIMIQAHQRRRIGLRQASALRHKSLEALTAVHSSKIVETSMISTTGQTGAVLAVSNRDGRVIYVRRVDLAQRYLAQQRRRIAMRRTSVPQHRLVAAAIEIQAGWRRLAAQRRFSQLQEDRRMISAVTVIQAHQRRCIALHQTSALQQRRMEAIVAVQAGWRLMRAQNNLLQLKESRRVASAVRIQASQRRRIALRRTLALRCKSVEAITKLKAGWQRLAAQRHLLQLLEDKRVQSAVVIQAQHRRRIALQRSLVLRCRSHEVAAAVKAGFRRLVAQRCLLQMRAEQRVISAETIQATWHRHQVRKMYLGIKGSRSCMQLAACAVRWRRRCAAADVDALELLLARMGAALTLQAWWRQWLLAKSLTAGLNCEQILASQDDSDMLLSDTSPTISTVSEGSRRDTLQTISSISGINLEPGPEPSPQHKRKLEARFCEATKTRSAPVACEQAKALNFHAPPSTPRGQLSTFRPQSPQVRCQPQPCFVPESGMFCEVPQEATRSCWLATFFGGGCSLKRGRRSLTAAKIAAQNRRQAPHRLRYSVLVKEAVAVLPEALAQRIREDAEMAILVLPKPQHRESWGWPEKAGLKPQTCLTNILLAYEWRVTKTSVTKRVGASGQFDAYEYSMGLCFLAGLCFGFLCGREEEAFWLFVHVLEDIYGPAYFSRTPPLLGQQGDCAVIGLLIESRAPRLTRILGPEGMAELCALLGKHCLSCGLIGCLADDHLLTIWEQVLDRRCAAFPRLPLLAWLANLVGLCEDALIRLSKGSRTADAAADAANSCVQHLIKQGPHLPAGARLHLEFPELRIRELARLAGRPLAIFLGADVDAGVISEQGVV